MTSLKFVCYFYFELQVDFFRTSSLSGLEKEVLPSHGVWKFAGFKYLWKNEKSQIVLHAIFFLWGAYEVALADRVFLR